MNAKRRNDKPPVIECDDVPRVTITLTDESIYLTRHDRRGAPAATYPVTAASVANAFNLFGASTGLLPANALFWQSWGGKMRVGMWVAPGTHTLHIRRKTLETYSVPLPGMVFVGEGMQYKIFAAADRPTRPSDRLYHCPLPNVYPGGNICTGDVAFPICSEATIDQAVRLFFESEFNYDLAGRGTLEMLKRLRGKRTFPLAELRTFEHTLDEVMGGAPNGADRDGDDDPREDYADGIDPYEMAYNGVNEDD